MGIEVIERDSVAYASAARVASPIDFVFSNYHGRGLLVVIDVTAETDTPSVVFNVRGRDSLGKSWLILASAAITSIGTVILRIHPELTAAANLIAKDIVPITVVIDPVHGNADSITYSVSVIPTL